MYRPSGASLLLCIVVTNTIDTLAYAWYTALLANVYVYNVWKHMHREMTLSIK